MSNKKNALGKGLSALLENSSTDITSSSNSSDSNFLAGSISRIPISYIKTNPFQPRIDFEKEPLLELTNSIKEHGLIQPITVRKLGRDQFQIISGERRYQASKLATLDELPCFIRIANDQEMLEMAIVENVQRKDLNAIEIGLSFKRLIEECHLTQEQLSVKIGKNRSTISNFLRLLKLPVEIQKAIRDQNITMGHAKALLALNDAEEILKAFNTIITEKLSVRATENLTALSKKKKSIPIALSRYEMRMQNDLSFQFNSTVKISKAPKGNGKIVISFKDEEDLTRILDSFEK
jgi:ParB family transcriptional regulator, chromosome partitioning protein